MKHTKNPGFGKVVKFGLISMTFLVPAITLASVIVTSANINGVSFPGGAAITVNPGQVLTVKTTALNSFTWDRWLYTQVYITKNGVQTGSSSCVNTTDVTTTGSHSVTFSYTVPANVSGGAAALNLRPFSNSTCTQSSGSNYRVLNSLNIVVPVVAYPVTISPTTVTKPSLGTSYAQTLTASTTASGPFTWSLTSGILPSGLVLNNSTTKSTTISGTPTTAGTYNFSVRITNGVSSTTVAYTAVVDAVVVIPSVTISPSTITKPVIGTSYAQTLTASTTATGPFFWFVSNGSLPTGLSLASSTTKTVNISGTPTTAGTYNFSVKVTNGTSSTTASYTAVVDAIVVPPPPPPPVVTNLILNSDLQSASVSSSTPDFWHLGGWDDVFTGLYPVAGPNPGDKAAQVTVTTHNSGFADWYSDAVVAEPLAQYNFSDWYLSDKPTIVEAQYSIAGTPGFVYSDIAYLPATNGVWAKSDVTFETPVNTTGMTIFHLLNSVGSLSITKTSLSKVSAPSTFSSGMVSLTFDDGTQTQYDVAFPMLEAADLPATFYVISGEMTQASQFGSTLYMNQTEVLNVNQAGHEIGNHTVNHCNLATGLCPDGSPKNSPDLLTAIQEMVQANSTLLGIGALPLNNFAYPYGAYNQSTIDTVKSSGLMSARSVDRGFNLKNSNRYALKIQYVNSSILNSSDFQSTIKPWIDSAIANKTWLILLFHEIEPASVIAQTGDPDATTPEVLQSTINYLKQNSVPVVTVQEGVCKMDGMSADPRCLN